MSLLLLHTDRSFGRKDGKGSRLGIGMTGQFPPNCERAAYLCIFGEEKMETSRGGRAKTSGRDVMEGGAFGRFCMCMEGRWMPDRYPPRSSHLKSLIYDSPHEARKNITIDVVDAPERCLRHQCMELTDCIAYGRVFLVCMDSVRSCCCVYRNCGRGSNATFLAER